jgi:hypothetical protein
VAAAGVNWERHIRPVAIGASEHLLQTGDRDRGTLSIARTTLGAP